MPVDRPTFSESWYRVASLRPKLRPMVQTYRQQHRGRICHVVHDPSNNNFFRLEEPAYRFVGLLDGRRTVADVWTLANEQLGDDGPTQNEVIQVLGQLYTFNLLEGDLPPDAAGLFERYRQRIRREVTGYLMNVMSMRFPILDPDRFLDRWAGLFTLPFTWPAFLVWLALLTAAGFALAGRGADLIDSAAGTLDPSNMFLLFISFSLIKGLHEFGHAFACKRFGIANHSGGEVHTMGIMLLVLLPMPYVDASSAWAFRSRWQRAVVGAAGMYVELAAAAISAMVWANTSEGTLVHTLTYNIMFVSGVSTLLFNANPLLRYDGYYILSDLLEMPNLAQRSSMYLYYLVKRYIYGVRRPNNPANTLGERPWLLAYAIASGIYRVIVSVGIILFIVNKLWIIGFIMAIGGIIGWVIMPMGRFFHYLFVGPELTRHRPRAILTTAAAVAAALIICGVIPVADRERAEGFVVPVQMAYIYTGSAGFVDGVLTSGGQVTPTGDNLLTASNPHMVSLQDQLNAKASELRARTALALKTEASTAQAWSFELDNINRQQDYNRSMLDELNVHAPFAGTWVAPDIDRFKGAYRPRGDQLGVVANLHHMFIRVATDQSLGPRIGPDDSLEIRVKGRPEDHWIGRIKSILPAGQTQLPTPALSWDTGGSLAVDPEDPKGQRAAERFFEVWIEPTKPLNCSPLLMAGQRVVVRFELSKKPLLLQWWRLIRQTIQRRFQF